MAHDFGGGNGGGEARAARVPVGSTAAEEARIPHPRTARFVYAYHPMRWFKVGDEWLPDLKRKVIDVGVGRVDSKFDDALMRVSELRAGGVIIEPKMVPPNTPDGTYLAAYRCKEGTHYCSVWETPQYAGSTPLGHAVDLDGFHDWLRWLVKEGIVPRISEPVRQRLEAKLRKREAKRAAREAESAAKPAKKAPAKKAPADG